MHIKKRFFFGFCVLSCYTRFVLRVGERAQEVSSKKGRFSN